MAHEGRSGLEDLIEAFTILSKYDEERTTWPTNCEHDILRVYVAKGNAASAEDARRLESLSFHWDGDFECWYSYRFGSN